MDVPVLFIRQLMDAGFFLSFGYYAPWTFLSKHLCGHIVSSPGGTPRSRTARSHGSSMSNAEELSDWFPKWLHQFCISTSSVWGFWFPIFTNTCNQSVVLVIIIIRLKTRDCKVISSSFLILWDEDWGKLPSSPLHAGSMWGCHPESPALREHQAFDTKT